jgi:hypothetical protein
MREEVYCMAPHPTMAEYPCKRLVGHEGDHAAYTFLLSEPDRWPPGFASTFDGTHDLDQEE